MTTEEKAKAYDEATERAEGLINFCSDSELKTLEYVFPELKKSEDERIRKAIIEGLREMKSSFHTISSIKIDDAIAWLEKQGKETSWKPSDEQIQTLEYYMHNLICNKHKETLFGLYNDLKKLKEK